MIPVTKPFLPPRAEYEKLIAGIWERCYLTNHGPLVQELEKKLCERFGLDHLQYVASGTTALQIAIRVLGLRGEIITTPFSYVATTSSIVWQGCRPVFVDIDPGTLNIDPAGIEAAITPHTSAIVATHCFGNPCDVEAIADIAARHNLRVIYDAAHAFGTRYHGRTLFAEGDISVTSFHATKLFHTVEGGAVITRGAERVLRVRRMRNFGHAGPERFSGVGINGKNSEFHAAMGLCNLTYVDEVLASRKRQAETYDVLLAHPGIQRQKIRRGTEYNYAYYPVILPDEPACLAVKAALEGEDIWPRRYFYPDLSQLDYVTPEGMAPAEVPVAADIASRILCLPVYHELTPEVQEKVASVIVRTLDALTEPPATNEAGPAGVPRKPGTTAKTGTAARKDNPKPSDDRQ